MAGVTPTDQGGHASSSSSASTVAEAARIAARARGEPRAAQARRERRRRVRLRGGAEERRGRLVVSRGLVARGLVSAGIRDGPGGALLLARILRAAVRVEPGRRAGRRARTAYWCFTWKTAGTFSSPSPPRTRRRRLESPSARFARRRSPGRPRADPRDGRPPVRPRRVRPRGGAASAGSLVVGKPRARATRVGRQPRLRRRRGPLGIRARRRRLCAARVFRRDADAAAGHAAAVRETRRRGDGAVGPPPRWTRRGRRAGGAWTLASPNVAGLLPSRAAAEELVRSNADPAASATFAHVVALLRLLFGRGSVLDPVLEVLEVLEVASVSGRTAAAAAAAVRSPRGRSRSSRRFGSRATTARTRGRAWEGWRSWARLAAASRTFWTGSIPLARLRRSARKGNRRGGKRKRKRRGGGRVHAGARSGGERIRERRGGGERVWHGHGQPHRHLIFSYFGPK